MAQPHASPECQPPETVVVHSPSVYCDGAFYGDGDRHVKCANIPAALGHPRVYLVIPAGQQSVDCPYCDRRFSLGG